MPRGKRLTVTEKTGTYVCQEDFEGPLYKIRHRLNEIEEQAKKKDSTYTEISIQISYAWNEDGHDEFEVVGKRPETDKEMEKRLGKNREERKQKKENKEAQRRKEKEETREMLRKYPEILEEFKEDESITEQSQN